MDKTPLKVRELILEFGITLEAVSVRARCRPEEVEDMLSPDVFVKYPLIQIVRVRIAIEQELSVRGWSGSRKDLWREFDTRIEKLGQR